MSRYDALGEKKNGINCYRAQSDSRYLSPKLIFCIEQLSTILKEIITKATHCNTISLPFLHFQRPATFTRCASDSR